MTSNVTREEFTYKLAECQRQDPVIGEVLKCFQRGELNLHIEHNAAYGKHAVGVKQLIKHRKQLELPEE